MKKFLVVLFSCCLLFQEANANNLSLETTVQKVLQGFQKQDSSTINTLIHKDIGLYVVFRVGVPNVYAQVDGLDFHAPIPGYLPYSSLSNQTLRANRKVTRYGKLPQFNCDTESWSQNGLSVGNLGQETDLLSDIAMFAKQYDSAEISDEEIATLKNLESKSRRVVLTSQNGDELVFHLSHIEGRWYLTLLDRVTSDCSA